MYFYAGASGVSFMDAAKLGDDLSIDGETAYAAWKKGTEIRAENDKARFKPETSLANPTLAEAVSDSKNNAPGKQGIPQSANQNDSGAVENALDAESSIELSKDVEAYPYDVQKVLKEYTEYSDKKVSDFAKRVIEGKAEPKERIFFNNVSEKAANRINEILGVNVSGFKVALEKRIAEHINKRHGKNGTADHSMAHLKDWEKIQYVLDNYDTMEYGGKSEAIITNKPNGKQGPADTVVYSKKINGTFYVVEAVPITKAKTLNIVSAYINKKGTEAQSSDAKGPTATSKTSPALVPTTNIPQKSSSVKKAYDEAARVYRTEENAKEFDEAYNIGLAGETLDGFAPDADITSMTKAYMAGVHDRAAFREREAQRTTFNATRKGLSSDDLTETLIKRYSAKTREVLQNLGEALGVQIKLITNSGIAGHEMDSYYDSKSGVIAINVNEVHRNPKIKTKTKDGSLSGDDLIRFVTAHEGIHRIKETSPKAYAQMEKIALSKSKVTVSEYMKEHGVSGALAKEEITADYFGDLLTNKAEIKALLNKNRGLFDIIWEVLKKIGRVFSEAGIDFAEIAEARRLFREALSEADSSVWGEDVRSGGEVMLSSGGKTIDLEAIGKLRSIVGKHSGERVSVNDFTSEDIKAAEDFAKKYFEEMGVKSPFFRAWFGDWRVGDNGYSETVLHAGELRGEYQNKDTGWKLIVSRKIHKETNHHGSDKVKNAKKYLPYIKEITENAILLDSFVSEDENNLSAMYHKLYAYSEAYGYPALLKLTVEELIDEKSGDAIRRNYILHNIEEESLSKRNRLSTPNHDEGNSSRITISELFALVKQFDKEFKPKPSSLVVNEDGTPMVVYHQTKNNFTVFDTRHEGAGTRDEETPFGVFLKPTKENIGIKGEIQMPLYAAITNPLGASDRGELVSKLKGLSDKYAELYDAHKKLDAKFKKEFDKAAEDFKNYLIQWRKENPEASRRAIYEDENFEKMYGAEEKVLEEWEKEARALELEMKEEITAALKHAKYDGVHIKNDAGSFGKKTETYIALENTQVKSATDNIGTFDSGDSDILFSRSENWRPDLTRKQLDKLMSLIDNDIKTSTKVITKTANWFTTRMNGNTVFAIYSTEDSDNPTLLYESKGEKAVKEKELLLKMMEDYEDGKNKSFTADTILGSSGMQQGNSVANSNDGSSLRRGKGRDDRVLQKASSEFNGSAAFRSVVQNLFGISGTEGRGNRERSGGRGRGRVTSELLSRSEEGTKYFPKGEEPRRDIDVPSEIDGKKVMRGARTAAEAPGVSDEIAEDVVTEIENGRFFYTPSVNSVLMANAESRVSENYDEAMTDWLKVVGGGRVMPKLNPRVMCTWIIFMDKIKYTP